MTFHYSSDGNILLKDSDEARDQDEFWESKEQNEKKMAQTINAAIIAEFGEDPLKDDPVAQKKALRNQFNYQERASQTFNLPIREKGMKTAPPVCSTYSVETT